jgi:hypothetical protein
MQYKRQPAPSRHTNEFGEPRFVHESVFKSYSTDGPEIVMSFCTKCHRYIAASHNAELLEAVEANHRCFVPATDVPPKAA